MSIPAKQSIENLLFNLGCAIALLVLILSVYNGYSILMIALRTLLAFVVIYAIGRAAVIFWTKVSPPPVAAGTERRPVLDVVLGDPHEDDLEDSTDTTEQTGGALRQAYAGQINTGMKDGLKDSASKAEIGRRMGLEETK